jgi:hypothetical protein
MKEHSNYEKSYTKTFFLYFNFHDKYFSIKVFETNDVRVRLKTNVFLNVITKLVKENSIFNSNIAAIRFLKNCTLLVWNSFRLRSGFLDQYVIPVIESFDTSEY